jgi:hypothetical protein
VLAVEEQWSWERVGPVEQEAAPPCLERVWPVEQEARPS